MSQDKLSNDEKMQKYIDHYLNKSIKTTIVNPELEVRFGTISKNKNSKITKNDFNNVMQKLTNCGFVCMNNDGDYTLKVSYDYTNKEGKKYQSNVRLEINSLHTIESYCEKENINLLLQEASHRKNILMTKKAFAKDEDGETFKPINVDNYNFRMSYQIETEMDLETPFIVSVFKRWDEVEKVYRYIKRFRFKHESMPVFVDLSIVKTNSFTKTKPYYIKKAYVLADSNVFNNLESYEIEIEVDNESEHLKKDLLMDLKKTIKYVLCGIQNTNYPIGYKEMDEVSKQYLELLHLKKEIHPSDFIGPNSYTLQLKNVINFEEELTTPSILKNYTVTDKADGERHLLYINGDGLIFLIDTNMRFIMSGSVTKENKIKNTILDGELITHNKHGKFVNLFAAFDVYIVNKKNVKPLIFTNVEREGKTRLNILNQVVQLINPQNIVSSVYGLKVQVKHFEITSETNTIFDCCNKLFNKIHHPSFDYETDGLIFTPADQGLPKENNKFTWDYSFKWKPPQFNTIDFLISFKRDDKNKLVVNNIYQEGVDLSNGSNIAKYITLHLMCGFNEGDPDHGYMNPCQMVMDDVMPQKKEKGNYQPVLFYPTQPYDKEAHICNIELKLASNGKFEPMTEENEIIEDNTIVEFKYVMTNENHWRWVPLRVRYDKTYQMKRGFKNYGNAYHVANSNWYSIHNPITEDMLKTGQNIPSELVDDDVYYNRVSGISKTRGMRDFHNMVVKKLLIQSVCKRGKTLIDFAVGKGGDFPKWISSKLSFVYGIDISLDNIENKLDGACARFLNYKKMNNNTPACLFVEGNSGLNIRKGDAIKGTKYKQVNNAIFGKGPKDESKLGKGVYKQYGKGENGFEVSACMFAIHYFFKDSETLHSFLQNVSECTKIGGHFIGACYDGKAVFNLLKEKKKGEGIIYHNGNHKIFEIVKDYDKEELNDDVSCLNYPIKVFQETINKSFVEYLVNFDYFIRVMENFGFIPVPDDEVDELKLPSAIGHFGSLHNYLVKEVELKTINKNSIGQSLNMSFYEKKISFLNKYFVFKKVRNVDSESVVLENKMYIEELEKTSENTEIVKIKRKIKLKKQDINK